MTAHDRELAAGSDGGNAQNLSQAWQELAADYEQARAREDSLDRLVEWPAEREILGDVNGRSILDLGCGNGGKLAELSSVMAQSPAPVSTSAETSSPPRQPVSS